MKVFNLKCVHGHAFEGWFKSHLAFEEQQAQGLLTCPFCDSNEIEKTLSAPRLNLSSAAAPEEAEHSQVMAEPAASRGQAAVMTSAPGGAPALAAALKMVRDMLTQSEDVGDRFAEEARAMHANELPARPIHGQTSLETAQELAEEGIPVVAIPFGNLLKTPLQ